MNEDKRCGTCKWYRRKGTVYICCNEDNPEWNGLHTGSFERCDQWKEGAALKSKETVAMSGKTFLCFAYKWARACYRLNKSEQNREQLEKAKKAFLEAGGVEVC